MASGSKSKAIVKDIVIVAVGVLVIWIGLTTVFGTQNPFYVVSSGSMIPELQIYDVIVVQGNDPFEEVEIGDIIVFDRPTGHDRVIVHRVVAIVDDDPYTVRTQGDANPASIPGTDFPITAEEYIGTVAYVIPQVGFITRIFATQIGGIPLNYIIIVIIVGIMVVKQMTKKKDRSTRDYSSTETKNDEPIEFSTDDVPKDSEYSEKTDSSNDLDAKENSEFKDDEDESASENEDKKE